MCSQPRVAPTLPNPPGRVNGKSRKPGDSDRLFVAERDLAALSRTWTRRRLVHLLLKLAENLGEPDAEGTLIRVPITHETLANMIGASRVRVTSMLSQFQREGLLTRQGRFMVVRTGPLRAALARHGG